MPMISHAMIALAIAPAPAADDYRYTLDAEAAMRCAVQQTLLLDIETQSGGTGAPGRKAMAMTWLGVATDLVGSDAAEEALRKQVTASELATIGSGDARKAALQERLKTCAVLRNLYMSTYTGVADMLGEAKPELFDDHAALKSQTGLDVPDPPTRTLTFGPWKFEARRNSCVGTRSLGKGAELRLGFTNFMDGSIRLIDPGMPRIDVEADDLDAVMAKHSAGADMDEDFHPRFADGVTYATYPGTALFVDGKLAASFYEVEESEGPPAYRLGALQGQYYNMLPTAKTVTIKVLAKERHRFTFDDAPGFWNEMSNCVAQYPNG